MRKLMKGCTFPDPYWVEVPFLNKETGLVEIQECPVLLPHEVLAYFVEKDASRLSSWMPTPAHGVIHNAVDWCNKFGEDMRSMIPLGLHGDGVPFASKMRDSLECISWNILTDASGVRILFTTFPKSFLAGRETWDALLGTFAWSMRMLLLGVMPSSRHDGKPWKDNDVARAQNGGKALGFVAGLLQVRGDWAFYKEVFEFPGWQSKQCCWRCCAKNAPGEAGDFRICSTEADWRQQRLTGYMYLVQQKLAGILPSPLFESPGLTVDMVMVDWLHTMDQGVIADVIGNVFWELLPLLFHGTRKLQVQTLWGIVKIYYHHARVPDRLDGLTAEMIKAKGKSPKQRGRAAQVRYLLPLAAQLAEEHSHENGHWLTVAALTDALLRLTLMNNERPYPASQAADLSRRVALLYTGLEMEAVAKGNTYSWRVKPKLHLMQELIEYQCQQSGSPCQYWTYKDESWGAWLAAASVRRGGRKTAWGVALSSLLRFRYLMHKREGGR